MKKVFLIPLMMVLVNALVFAGCAAPAPALAPAPAPAPAPKPSPTGTPAPVPAKAEWNLKFHHHNTGKTADVLANYAKTIEDATKGRVKVTVYPSATLGKAQEAYELTTSGTADIAWGFTGFFPGQFPMTDFLSIPLLGAPTGEGVARALWALYEKFPDAFAKEYKEVKLLNMNSSGTTPTSTTKKPIRTMEDFNGMIIRTAAGPPADFMKALGASPTTISTTELYAALEKGVVQGCNLGINPVVDNKLYEVCKYFHETNLYAGTFWTVMNKKTWDSMPPDVQNQIMSANGLKGSVMIASGFDKLIAESWAVVKALPGKEVITYSPQERARWSEKAKPIWDAYVKQLVAKGLPGQEVLDYVLKLAKEYK